MRRWKKADPSTGGEQPTEQPFCTVVTLLFADEKATGLSDHWRRDGQMEVLLLLKEILSVIVQVVVWVSESYKYVCVDKREVTWEV
ncbi:hypothetical protein SPDO_29670 [Sphingomonas dokdonensis]|uniref:Uncharacterized protein n=1 Tax=Sphingomonas dokdonensis TaxID=344880 RepID=A0A245ZDS3_9SPHN|nr:hypothetical protein SPDO_29670 [Sphingomonas dokdonensis]